MAKIDADSKKVLSALVEIAAPASNKQISEAAGLDSKIVTKQIKSLKDQGFVNSPARCKYAITDEGKGQIK
ncbi:MAG TPA: ArsR family transcriptional regulator [candidate division Zixibacteria bacterium]|nr:ArsR family transcriptional regulator [candidate division Zixibacteria bacterium]